MHRKTPIKLKFREIFLRRYARASKVMQLKACRNYAFEHSKIFLRLLNLWIRKTAHKTEWSTSLSSANYKFKESHKEASRNNNVDRFPISHRTSHVFTWYDECIFPIILVAPLSSAMNSILRSLFDRFGSIRSAWQLFLSVFCQISSLISMPCLLLPLLYITTCLMLVNHVRLFSVTLCLPISCCTFFHSVCSECYLWGWYLPKAKGKTELIYRTKLQIQSQGPWTLHGIIKLVISLLIFDIVTKKWEDIAHFRPDKERY